MSPSAIDLTCPSCEAAVRTHVPAAQTDGGEDAAPGHSALTGQPVTCGRCAHEFEVLFYP